MIVATLLKLTRENLDLTRKQVARRIGVSSQFYGHIESAKVGLPKRLIKPICSALGLSPNAVAAAIHKDYQRELTEFVKRLK